MLKYTNCEVTFSEVPDEITLCINISGCPHRCEGCHSPFLWEDAGKELNEESLSCLIERNSGVSCVSFMGGDADYLKVEKLAIWTRNEAKKKVCWYTGFSVIPDNMDIGVFDYIKVGPYEKELGGLSSERTNQRFYQVRDGELVDITYKFRK